MKKIALSLVLIFTLSYSIKAQLTIDSTNVTYTCLDCDSIGVVPLPSSYGSLYIAVSGGTSPYSFSLTGLHSANLIPLTTTSVSGITSFYNSLCQDTFTLQISDAIGASTSFNFTTVPPPSPTLSIDSVSVKVDSTNNPDSGVIELHVTTNADSVFYLIQDINNSLNLGTNGGWQDSTVFDSLPGGYYYKVFVDVYPKIIPSCGNGFDIGTSIFQIYVPLACENDGFADFGVYPACVGEQVFYQDFSFPGSGVNNIITQWNWDFGDGGFGGGSAGIHTYTQSGIYMVQLTISTSHGCFFGVTYPVTISALPTPLFSSTNNGSGQYTFSDLSTVLNGTITGWSWNFGDGATSTMQNPVYQYTTPGSYNVCLIVTSNNNCVDSVCQNIDFTVGVNSFSKEEQIRFYPNPVTEEITISSTNYQEVRIIDVTGKLVKIVTNYKKTIDVRELEKGIYFLKIKIKDKIYVKKFIKE